MIEVRIICDDEEYVIGEFAPAEILSFHKALKASEILDEEGRIWQVKKLYFNLPFPYFFISTDQID